MKKIVQKSLILFLILCLVFVTVGCRKENVAVSENSSNNVEQIPAKKDEELLNLSNLTEQEIDNLELLGRIWGFLKYHHSTIAKGVYNWDEELFKFLPSYLKVESTAERDELFIKWIDSFGEIKESTPIPVDEKSFLKPDLKWIDDQDDALKNKLLFIYNNRFQGLNHYVTMTVGVGNPKFTNENAYSDKTFPDAEFRLLSLYRYWNMIYYFYPYKYLMDEDWNIKLKEYIPKFIDVKNELEYELIALQLIGDIHDTHANIWGGDDKIKEWKGLYFPPVHLRFIEDKLVVTDYYNEELKEETGLQIGDIITKIEGKTIEEIIKEREVYYPSSNHSVMLRDLSFDLLRSTKDTIDIEYISKDESVKNKTLQLYLEDSLDIYFMYRDNKGKAYKMLDNNIGYITLDNIKEEDIPAIKEEFKDTKGIILDIRNYPSLYVPYSLGSYFVSSTASFVKLTYGNVYNPGEFKFTENMELGSEGDTYKGKLIVLVNELSQSQAEYTALAFRAGDNTTIIGSQTAGADGNVSEIMLPGGLRTYISGLGVYYPNGEETQRIGIVPDIEVKPTIEGIRMKRDELLEKAIEIILEE